MTEQAYQELQAPYQPTRRKSRSGLVLLALVLAFAGGAGAAGWLAAHPGLGIGDIIGTSHFKPAAAHGDAAPIGTLPATNLSANSETAMEARVIALEQRLARIDLQANAEEANTAHAEALLVAFAARRATERGAPLGYLEDQLKLRFGDALPGAVATVTAAQKAPVTLDQLSARLQAMAPTLTATPATTSGWAELRNLFVLRHASAPAPTPAARIDHAEMALREGRIDDAIADVQRLPGGGAAGGWIVDARRYAQVEQALDLLETTALLEPARLRGSNGHTVTPPAVPLTNPAPTPAPSAQPR